MTFLKRRAAIRRGQAIVASIVAAGALATAAVAQEASSVDDLVKAAKTEAPINIYDSTGKIVEMADNFSKRYGLKATGIKVSASSQLEMIVREGQAKNVQGDVVLITDAPAGLAQLLPGGYVESWLPPDMKDRIPAKFQDPLSITTNASVWAYNTEVYDSCPVKNIWELTEPKWKGKVAFYDPLSKGTYPDWFNQTETHFDAEMKDAYKARFGKDIDTGGEESATAAWVKAFAQNGPLLADSDDAISEAVGAPGQKEPFFGLLSSAKFRDNADKDFKLGLCADMGPWPGWTYVKLGLIASGTRSPNTAKLFIHYILTEEGIAPQVIDGKLPTNPDIKIPADEPSGITRVLDKLEQYDTSTALDDWDARQDWQDFWRVNYKK
ncbi:ABC transporter substrate-binding protein [Mesorhizobium sp. Root554]|uniref:ABC transporter substrate-binding protein n=1 Tax=unclassified Mesorhizobium TaxID=325217 RepID=UPI00070131FC|nr:MULTISPECIES: ABC transporter substrate-binding protein [unclassified Mesorhizobium]KQZ15123.1 ABC transporter substrate-binding protein [Mesorhizobium sp. Root1471]KQZ37632.1 ABC transporter substrate-binding protein [Mesorhizobium sp. Root554]